MDRGRGKRFQIEAVQRTIQGRDHAGAGGDPGTERSDEQFIQPLPGGNAGAERVRETAVYAFVKEKTRPAGNAGDAEWRVVPAPGR